MALWIPCMEPMGRGACGHRIGSVISMVCDIGPGLEIPDFKDER